MNKKYLFLIFLLFVLVESGITINKVLPKFVDILGNKALESNKDFNELIHEYNTCEISLNNKNYDEAALCFGQLLQKHDRNDIRYSYAVALAQKQEYTTAKKELKYIIENEKDPDILERAKDVDKQIDNILAQIEAMKATEAN